MDPIILKAVMKNQNPISDDLSGEDSSGFIFKNDSCYFDPILGFVTEFSAMDSNYIVANLKTAIDQYGNNQIVEIAAIRVESNHGTVSKFSRLVCVVASGSRNTIEQCAIWEHDVGNNEEPIIEVIDAFLAFVNSTPVFLYDGFDEISLLKSTCDELFRTLDSPLYSVSHMVCMTGKDLTDFDNFGIWIKQTGVSKIHRRAIDDARSISALLLEIRKKSHLAVDPEICVDSGSIDYSMEFEIVAALSAAYFIVADIEVTGTDPTTDQIIEFAALLVDRSGKVISEFSMIVSIDIPVPEFHLSNDYYSQDQVNREGCPLAVVMQGFRKFIGTHPLFVFDMWFDLPFYLKAEKQTGIRINNQIYDVRRMAQKVWAGCPDLHNFGYSELEMYLVIPKRRNSVLDDARFIFDVLFSLRNDYGGSKTN